MTAPRFYSWDDDGSPGRALTGNMQNRLKQILVACLVNGYGSKPGAGWTLEHEHANGFTLSNGDAYVNFVSNLLAAAPYPAMDGSQVHIYVAESIYAKDEAIIDGANLCSGPYRKGSPEDAAFSRQVLNWGFFSVTGLSTVQWTLVADEKTFILVASTNDSATITTRAMSLYAGACVVDSGISAPFIVLCGDNVAYNRTVTSYSYCRGFTAPRNLLTGLAGFTVIGAYPYIFDTEVKPAGKKDHTVSKSSLQPLRLLVNEVPAGQLRGVVYDDYLRSHLSWKSWLKALGFSGEDYRDRGKLVQIDGSSYAYARGYSGDSFLTDNPAFW